jgi:hypothetical protein
MHVEDLIQVEKQLGYRYELPDAADQAEHYQRICPKCRRSLLALAQGRLWAGGTTTADPFEESIHHG